MNICVPITADQGLGSPVCAHFGSAPAFCVIDTNTESYSVVVNQNQHHGHGMCMPLESLQGIELDGIVVAGIGMGALRRLNASNIQVYASDNATVADVLATFRAGRLEIMQPSMACGHQRHGACESR